MVNLQKTLRKNWPIVLIALFGLFVSWPLFRNGYFSHQDDLQIIRIFEMRKCLVDGQIPCRWVPDMGWGNGFPLFNFYGVFPYYLGAFLSFFVGYIASAKILFLISLIAGSFGMYLLVKDIWGKYAGVVSAVLYMFAPYKALDVYVRGALSESMALALIPFVFYFFYRLIMQPGKKNTFFYSTVFLFLFLITHNIMTVIFLPILFAWVIYWLCVNKREKFEIIIFSFVLAFGMSAFFTMPAFIEKGLVQTESLTRFELDYRANFLKLRQLFLDRAWGYGTSIPGPEGGMNFQIGWPYWLLAGVSSLFLFVSKFKKSAKVLVGGIFVIFILSILMTHNKSTLIWEHIKILSYFQFPWRFLSLSIFSASILGGIVVFMLKEKWQKPLTVIIVVLTIILNWSYFKPREFYNITDAQKLSGELWDIQQRGAILDYLPKTALEPREKAPDTPLIISGNASVVDFANKTNRFSFNIEVDELSEIEIPIYYFPNWEVFVNGKVYPLNHDNLIGRIRITLEKGSYDVEGRFVNTWLRTLANIITLFSVVGFLVLLKKTNDR